MSFLLDTDTCSAHIKRPSGLAHRFTQYAGNLFLSTVAAGELFAWALHSPNRPRLLNGIQLYLLAEVQITLFDLDCAQKFGELRGNLLRQGIAVGHADLQIAATALVHNLTLVTHNTADFQSIPNLRLDDWLVP